MVESADDEVLLRVRVAAGGRLDRVAAHELEVKTQLEPQLLLPLLDQASGGNDQAAVEIAADHQLLDEEAGHDRLAGAGIVGEQKAQWLALEHLLVDRGDLMGKRLEI